MPKEDSRAQKLEELQEEYSKTKHNKATNKHLSILRAKISAVKKAIEAGGRKGGGFGFSVRKSGNATVVLVGFPNAGKSSLLRLLTGVDSKVADYAFTTVEVIPGMLEYNGAKIQFLDLPGLIKGAHLGKGGGREIVSVIRIANLILFVVDVNAPEKLYELIEELNALNVRVNKTLPRIRIEKEVSGGIAIEKGPFSVPDNDSIVEVLNSFSIYNGRIIFHQNATLDEIIDVLAGNCAYTNGVVALNKIDTASESVANGVKKEIEQKTGMKVVKISASKNLNADELREIVFQNLNLIRIFLKPRDGGADLSNPLVLPSGSTVHDVAKKINSKTAKNMKYAYVTGRSVKFMNQRIGIEHTLYDKDIVTLIYDNG